MEVQSISGRMCHLCLLGMGDLQQCTQLAGDSSSLDMVSIKVLIPIFSLSWVLSRLHAGRCSPGVRGAGCSAGRQEVAGLVLQMLGRQNHNDLSCWSRHHQDKHCGDKEESAKHGREHGGGEWMWR